MTKFSGFSLIEVIVSSVLVATAVGALFAAASLSTRLTTLGQERVAASQLAREGLEIAKNIRDQNFIDQTCLTGSAASSCADWHHGLLTTDGLTNLVEGAVTKRVAVTSTGYELIAAELGTPQYEFCTDYISRVTMQPDQSLKDRQDKVYCRRIFIEPVDDAQVENSTARESLHAIRIRSQVAWVGSGRNALRSFADSGVDVANPCATEADEWCTEQVTVLTDWRASND